MRALTLAALLLAAPAAAQEGCGGAAACEIQSGSYHIALPEADAPLPAMVFLHGFGGSGAGTMRQRGMIETVLSRGYAFLAPNGQPRAGRDGLRWDFRAAPGVASRDEDAFLRAVVADAARHGVDPDRVILAGFSNGAFQVTYLACRDPEGFAAFAPVAGGFWRPHPESCAAPVRLFQTHGWRDSTVPLEGRPLRGGAAVQGDIFAGLALWRRANGCAWDDPDRYAETGQFQRRIWDCAPGSALEMALFPGRHGVPEGWAEMVLDWFEALPAE
ncbi:alpha/beta hydrolase family esterase [Jannaschia seohaensis]|uniref:Polyhydroxybutyrate depolymerase n=1 Tax=Jannaschia seohaensis TaxID=475081 RepID=A0A2Y9B7X1_9RHOB|nr:alpha/beta fold hydrolase [Jannaschia seohaensis]PWJ13786.1 polyhydroxybutyrate depolymerase [Jannaschia seohaensis]SSA50299.1 polyhydroxybutyrate depolymerase [Jannaschia seohaensis]